MRWLRHWRRDRGKWWRWRRLWRPGQWRKHLIPQETRESVDKQLILIAGENSAVSGGIPSKVFSKFWLFDTHWIRRYVRGGVSCQVLAVGMGIFAVRY